MGVCTWECSCSGLGSKDEVPWEGEFRRWTMTMCMGMFNLDADSPLCKVTCDVIWSPNIRNIIIVNM